MNDLSDMTYHRKQGDKIDLWITSKPVDNYHGRILKTDQNSMASKKR